MEIVPFLQLVEAPVGPRTGLEAAAKRKIPALAENRTLVIEKRSEMYTFVFLMSMGL
jgi:hypothetical protein